MTTIDAEPDESVWHTAQRAVDRAASIGQEVEMRHDNLSVYVSPFSHPDDIATIHGLKHTVRRLELRPIAR